MREVVFARKSFIVVKKGSYYMVINKNKRFEEGHTHIRKEEMAIMIVKNVIKGVLPKTKDKYLILSHIRVATDLTYISMLKELINKS